MIQRSQLLAQTQRKRKTPAHHPAPRPDAHSQEAETRVSSMDGWRDKTGSLHTPRVPTSLKEEGSVPLAPTRMSLADTAGKQASPRDKTQDPLPGST